MQSKQRKEKTKLHIRYRFDKNGNLITDQTTLSFSKELQEFLAEIYSRDVDRNIFQKEVT